MTDNGLKIYEIGLNALIKQNFDEPIIAKIVTLDNGTFVSFELEYSGEVLVLNTPNTDLEPNWIIDNVRTHVVSSYKARLSEPEK